MIICPSVTAEEQEIVLIINFLALLSDRYLKKNSFWNRYIDKWNDLPASVVDLESVNSFK